MKASVKTTIVSLAALAIALIVSGIVLYMNTYSTLDLMEQSDARQRMRSIKAVIEEDALRNKDRANKTSLSDNPNVFFPGITYCDVFIYGDAGAKVFSSYLNGNISRELSGQTIAQAFLISSGENKIINKSFDESGVFLAAGRLIVYGVAPAKSPVAGSAATSGEQAYIMVGKLIDEAYMQKLSRFNDYTVSVVPYDSNNLAPDFIKAKAALKEADLPIYTSVVDKDWQNVYSLFRDYAARPVAIIKVQDTREQGYGVTYLTALSMLLILAAGLAVMAANLGGLRFGMLKGLAQALETISKIKDSSDLSRRIKVSGHDEMTELNTNINEMLSRLEKAHQNDFISHQLYEKLANVTHDRVIVFNRDLSIEFINEEATSESGEELGDARRTGWISPVPYAQKQRDYDRLRKVFATGNGEHFEEKREFDGGSGWVDTWMIPIKDETNQIVSVLVSSRDITERKLVETKTKRARDFYLYLFNNFPNPVWRNDAAGRCNYVNKAAVNFTGKEERILMDGGWESSVHPDDQKGRADLLKQAENTRTHTEIEYRLRGHDGTYRWVIDYVQPIYSLRNRFAGFHGTIIDVTERRLKADELAYMATHDMLTDTANRRQFDETIEKTIAKARRGENSSLLFMDIDDFKNINDSYGHLEGDKVLRAVADTAKSVLRKEDLLARLGGDEFAIILEGQDVEDAFTTAQRLAATVIKTVKLPGRKRVTTSIGVTKIGKRSIAGKVLEESDVAMYESKRRGGNRALIFEKGFIDYNY